MAELKRRFSYKGDYWIPLKNIAVDKEFIVLNGGEAQKYAKAIEKYLKTASENFYLTGEAGYIEPRAEWLQEVDYIDLNYGPVEFVYFDKNFNWLIYISHEDTVTFCGEQLVRFVKEKCID